MHRSSYSFPSAYTYTRQYLHLTESCNSYSSFFSKRQTSTIFVSPKVERGFSLLTNYLSSLETVINLYNFSGEKTRFVWIEYYDEAKSLTGWNDIVSINSWLTNSAQGGIFNYSNIGLFITKLSQI